MRGAFRLASGFSGGNTHAPDRLAPHVHGTEAQHYVTAGSRSAEAEHRAEAGENEHLVELMTQVRSVGTGDDVVIHHLPLGVNGNVDQELISQVQVRML